MNNNKLIRNIFKIHTTNLGISRIKKNLGINEEIISYCKNIILNPNSLIYQKGKNWYVELDSIILTINASSYTIITAHKKG